MGQVLWSRRSRITAWTPSVAILMLPEGSAMTAVAAGNVVRRANKGSYLHWDYIGSHTWFTKLLLLSALESAVLRCYFLSFGSFFSLVSANISYLSFLVQSYVCPITSSATVCQVISCPLTLIITNRYLYCPTAYWCLWLKTDENG